MSWLVLLLMVGSRPTPHSALLSNATVRECFSSMLAATRFGANGEEAGAFLIEDERGLTCQRWPERGRRRVTWRGPLPRGVMAIAHTHPGNAPLPSRHDREEAERLRIPFIVVSSYRVTAILEDGSTVVLGEPGWSRDLARLQH